MHTYIHAYMLAYIYAYIHKLNAYTHTYIHTYMFPQFRLEMTLLTQQASMFHHQLATMLMHHLTNLIRGCAQMQACPTAHKVHQTSPPHRSHAYDSCHAKQNCVCKMMHEIGAEQYSMLTCLVETQIPQHASQSLPQTDTHIPPAQIPQHASQSLPQTDTHIPPALSSQFARK
jgi:hypothetical protein